MKKLVFFLGIVCSPFLAKSQWVAGYSFKSRLTINNAVVCGSSDLTSFPLLVQLTGNFLKPSPTGLVSNANGYDIIFTSSDGTTILNHQIDHYISSTGEYAAWVQIPTLSVSASTIIYMYYGNGSITIDPSTSATWTSNVKTVYHFQNNNFNDATTYAINSTNLGTTNITAKFGDGRDLDGVAGYIQSNSSELKTDNDFTVSVWFKADATTPGHILWQGENSTLLNGWGTNNPGGESEMNLSMGVCCPGNATVSDSLSFYLGDREEEVNTDGLTARRTFTNTTSWQHAVATVSNMSTAPVANLYLNGVLVSTNAGAVSNVTDRTTWATNLRIGRPGSTSRFFNGQVDEVRIYNTALSADWVCTEYNNQNNTSTFTTLTYHPATLSAIEGTTLAYTEDDAATIITSTLTATDWDNNSFESATVSITGNYLSTEDVLSFTTAFGISASWNSTLGVLTLTPTSPATTASIANFISALRAVRYQNTNNGNPSTATRTIQFQVYDGAVFSNSVTRDISLTSLNDAPVLSGTNNFAAINEDNTTSSGTLVSALVSGQITDGDAGASTGIAITAVDNTNGAWQYTTNGGTAWNNFGSPAPATARLLTTDASTLIRFVPNANWSGTATITYRAWDQTSGTAGGTATTVTNGGTTAFSSSTASPSITVNAVNDVPVFTKGADQSVNEDVGAQSISGWATSIGDGDPELTQTLTFNVSNDNNALFSAQPAISATGVLTYTPAANANGTATVTVNISDNGSNVAPNVNISANQTFTITVNAVNDVPVFTKGANQSINEDAGAQSISGWATSIGDGDPELTQTLTFNVSNDNNTLFSSQPAISATGVLTYTPAANANGTATVTVSISDNGSNVAPNVNISAAQTFTITVSAVNDVPVFAKGADQLVNEDAGAQSISGWATSIGDGDPELTQTLTFNVSNDNNTLFSSQPVLSATGVLTYTPAANANGTATVTVSISDNGSNVAPNVNSSPSQTFTITVSAVNDTPVFTKGGDQSINEDAGAQSISGWATSIGDGDPELTQTLTFNVSNDNNTLFSSQPAISATGVLTYTPAANVNGTATVTVSISDNGSNVAPNVNISANQTFTITVSAVNDVPVFTKGANQSVNEDAGAQSISGWATGISDGDPELIQTLTFNVSNDNNALFSSQPAIDASTGNLAYTPAANVNGTATVTVNLTDNGSNVAPNVNISANQTFTITVSAVNDAPVFTKGVDQSINEDAGAQSISGWATGLSDGDPELTQTLTFNVSNDNNTLFSSQPALSSTGVLTYTPAANINGTATVTVSLSDNGSNVAPNINISSNQTFTITVSAVNDVPVFTKGVDQPINEDAGAQSISGWATTIGDGDPELTQTVTFNVSNDNNPLFSSQPAISATGVLTYTPAANATGTATVTVSIFDNGSNVAPNVNISANQTFTITVSAVNDAPVFTKGADQSINEDAGAQSISGWATGINDGDPELTQTLTFNVSNDNNALFSSQPAVSATGVLTYTPAANVNGTATVTVSLSDNGSNVAPNVNISANQTFTITVNAVNDVPVFTKGANQSINEDAGAQSISGWATSIGDGDPELTQTLTFNVNNDNNTLFSSQPAISATGVLTYTPAANANGTATVTVSISDNGSNVAPNVNISANQTFTITVSSVNDAPVFTKGGDQSVDEDAGAQSISGWATGISDGDPELTQTLTFNVSNDNNTLFSSQPAISATGVLTYTPAANVNGTAAVTVSLSDNGSNVAPNVNISANQTFTITVSSVNDVPVFTKGADQSVNEDVGAQSISGWATSIGDGDPELTQTLIFNVSNDNNTLFSSQPAISATGVLTYTPAANANGTATVTVSISDNGSNVAPNVNISANQTFTITVNAVNDAPVFTKGADESIIENAGAQSVSGWATGISDGDPELTQTLTFNVSNDNNALFTVQPSISAAGTLTYTGAANTNGSATVTVTLSDNGSGVVPNVNTSAAQTFLITIGAVNDAPVFTKGADQNVNEDAGVQTVSGWATGISDGDPELVQTLTFNVSNSNNSLFSSQPAISATGVLTYTPAANANGTATVTVSISDNGSNVAPNVNTSANQTFIITVSAVNDAPVFTKGGDQSVNEDAGAQSVSGWATGISDGDPELTQTLTFNVSNDNNTLFSSQPAISATGILTYTPTASANGMAIVTVSLSDNGSNVAPNVNISANQTFIITVNAVNDVPVFTKGADQSVNEDASAQSISGWATSIGDGDPELTQTLTFNVSNNNNTLFSSQPAISATGILTYTPAANANGIATVTVSISDNGSNVAPNVNTSANQTFIITVNAVNDVPAFTTGPDESIIENAGAQSVPGWATDISDGDPELTQTLTFNVSNDNNALFSVQPSISAAGTLTYTGAANTNGSATVTVTLSDNGSGVAPDVNTSAAQTFLITIGAVNDVPVFTKGGDQNVNEDAGVQTVSGWATGISDGDPELVQTLTFNVSNNNNSLFSSQPAVSATGVLTYTPAANANGTATVTISLSDNGSNIAPNINISANQTFIITVSAVNDVPVFAKGADQSVNEDVGAQSISGWATGISDGDPELTQTLTFNVSNDNNTLFSSQPAISATGVLTYTPAANANGTATVTVSISDNGSNIAPNVNTSANQTFTITLSAVNDVPVFTKGGDQNVSEDAGVQTVSGWATGISDGDPELVQTLAFNVSNNNNPLFSSQPAVSATGVLTYTPAANANGTATVTISLSDNGSNVAPNVNISANQTFTITVNAVNDVPVFTKGGDQSIAEDASTQTVTGWATGISDGDPELAQSLTFNVTNDNNTLFSTQPLISATGVLTYTPAANANGTAIVTVNLSDNGSNVAPNVNASANQTFTITVSVVNDVPVFTKGVDQSINEDAGAQSIPGWATGISDGDPELTQTLTFNVSNDNNPLFSSQPALSATGVLTYTPAANVNGTATVTVSLSDNGSNVAPNVNISANQTFTITVSAVNDAPVFTKGTDQSVNEDAGAQSISGWATGISDGDPELTQTLTFNVSNDNNTLFSSQPAISATGMLTYTPAANINGTATVTVSISDNGSNVAPNVNISANQTFTITVSAINDVPVFTKGADQNVNEDAGVQTVSGWATGISDGDPELVQTLAFNVSNNNTPLFSSQPAISATGILTYTLASNANGTATVTVSLSDNGSNVAPNVNTSTNQTFIITVNAVNDAPVFTKGVDQSVNEDAGAQTVSGWAASIADGDPELVQTLTFSVSNDNNTLFSVQPAIDASTGELTYTPSLNANGTATVTVSLSDNGLTVAPNVNTSTSQTFTITVNTVNDVPVFAKGADQSINEDEGPQTVASWATVISDGDPELVQTLTFNVSNDNNALFSVQPAIDASTGELAYTPSLNATGTAIVTVSLSDNGSNVVPNVNTSANQTFTIVVNAVNDAPVFTKGADESVNEDAGAQTVSGWVTGVSDGDPELTQIVTFNVSNDNNSLFSSQPAISATGELTYTPTANANGTATVTVSLSDNGSAVAPNINTSTSQLFVIVVNPVNDAPVAAGDSYSVVESGTINQALPGVLTNDSDIDNSFTSILVTSPSNGALTLNADGSFLYTHDGSETISDSFTYKVNDGITDGNTVGVTITIIPQNDAPVAADDNGVTTLEDTPVVITVLANDSDVDNALDPATVTMVSGPSNGNVSVNIISGVITYTPNSDYNGTDSFSYTVRDISNAVSGIAVVNIVVAPVDDAPVANDDNSTTPQDSPIVIDIVQNDMDVENSLVPSSIVIISPPAHGTISIIVGGAISYTPVAGYEGSDSFTYTIADMNGSVSNMAMVSILVTHTNSPPVAVDDGPVTVVNTLPVVIDVLGNDGDPDGAVSELTIVSVSAGTLGTAVIDNGRIVYQAFENISGDDSFTYVISDAMGLTDTAVVTIHYEYLALQVSEGFSPNGDGSNDTWYIKSIENYPDNSIKVFDRWGMLVYHVTRYDNAQGWNGRANTGQESGNQLEEGTYYYLLHVGGKKVFSGYLTLVR
jgi:gliding motility-associated-like protein